MLTSKKEMQCSKNKQEDNLTLLLTNYISYQNIVIFTGGNQFKIRNKKEFTEYTIGPKSLFFWQKILAGTWKLSESIIVIRTGKL